MGIKDDAGPRKKALIDSSSAILLFKSCLLEKTVMHYNTIMTESVFEELTRVDLAGSRDVKLYREEDMIRVVSMCDGKKPWSKENRSLESLGKGEHDTIMLFVMGCGDLIIMDDGKGANVCKKSNIPYINALLVPRILLIAGILSKRECGAVTRSIIDCGRYSEKIIEFGRSCPDEMLARFA